MFLPLNNNIYIKNQNGGVEEISTSRDSCDDLIHKEIVLDSEGFYTSFRLLSQVLGEGSPFLSALEEHLNTLPEETRNEVNAKLKAL